MRLFLAPMEGVVDHHFRTLYSEIGGVDACVSEFVRVNDLPVPRRIFLRDCKELNKTGLSTTPNGTPVRIQLLGSNPDTMAESAANAASLGASAIDLNFGCPAKTVNNSYGGAVLLKDSKHVGDIVRAVRNAVPRDRLVTAKMRLGYEDRSLYMENAIAIAEAGANELFVHARSKADGYNPPAYWSCLRDINEKLAIPVIANGEIWTVKDWRQCRQESGCEDFMLGRGLIACPDLALQIRASAAQQNHQAMSWVLVTGLLWRFYLETKDAYPQRFLGNRVKQWLFYLQMHYPEAGPFFSRIKRYKAQEQFTAAFATLHC